MGLILSGVEIVKRKANIFTTDNLKIKRFKSMFIDSIGYIFHLFLNLLSKYTKDQIRNLVGKRGYSDA